MRLVTSWLWADRGLPARVTRAALLPPALLIRAAAAVRARAYRRGIFPVAVPPLPTIAVGNLTVGGSGKTPIASWVAGWCVARGMKPAILLRGYGGDEGAVHRRLVPDAIVIEDADRASAARRAVAGGATVLVLDDAYQRLDVARDLNLVLVSAESGRAVPWTLPAGPWREGWRALRRADVVIVTRKRAGHRDALEMAARVRHTVPAAPVALARLSVSGFRGLQSDRPVPLEGVRGAAIVIAAGVGDPVSLAAQCRTLGAQVRLLRWRDHQPITPGVLTHLLQAAGAADYVVVTEKDAVKLHDRWPAGVPEPLVASLAVEWEEGAEVLEAALRAAVAPGDRRGASLNAGGRTTARAVGTA